MIIFVITLYVFVSLFDAGIFGGLCAFILSRPDKIVSAKVLAIAVMVFVVIQDLIMYAIVAPMDLSLTTGNPTLINLMGSPDLSDIFRPSFDLFNLGFYAIDVAVGTWFGRYIVRKYYKIKTS